MGDFKTSSVKLGIRKIATDQTISGNMQERGNGNILWILRLTSSPLLVAAGWPCRKSGRGKLGTTDNMVKFR